MKECWENILIDNSVVISKEVMVNKSQLMEAFENAFSNSGYDFIEWSHTKSAPYQCIISDGMSEIDVLLYLKNISNAGWQDKPNIKRVQVSNPQVINLDFHRFDDMKKISFIIGYYNFEKPIFVSWDAMEYRRHRTNRSCYVSVENLITGYINGFIRTDFFNQDITIFTPENMGRFLDDYFHDVKEKLIHTADKLYEITEDYYKAINSFESYWDGKDKIIEMRDENYPNWKQNEWQGFYFEFLMEKTFGKQKFFQVSFDNTSFDMFEYIPWDLKVHTLNSTSKNKIITNDINAIKKSIDTFGYQGFIILEGNAIFEEEGQFREWHNKIKGGLSEYQVRNKAAGKINRKRKKAFKLCKLLIVILDENDLLKHSIFQEDFINSNGKKRKPKLIINTDKLNQKNVLLEKELFD